MKRFPIILFLLTAVSCSLKPSLEKAGWDPSARRAINRVLRDTDSSAGAPFAVFDCDKTSIINDVCYTLLTWQIENLCFADAPSRNFTGGLKDAEKMVAEDGKTIAEAGKELSDEYFLLKEMQNRGISLEEIHKTPLYLDFRARMASLSASLGNQAGYAEYCLWMPGLLSGFTESEAMEIAKKSVEHWLSVEPLKEEWVSPDGRFRGTVMKGLMVPGEIKDLYRKLQECGIEVFICSASLETVVEALACDPRYGLGLKSDNVYGLRFAEDGGHILPEFLQDYPQPFKQGKADNIKAFMLPGHDPAGPVLVAGDSEGDVAMLTAFEGTRASLVFDYGKGGEIGNLASVARKSRNRGRYVVQTPFLQTETLRDNQL